MSGSIFGSANSLYDPGSVAQQSSIFGSGTNALSPAIAAAATSGVGAPAGTGFGFGFGTTQPGATSQSQQQVAVNPSVQQMFDANGNPIPQDQWQQAINTTPTPPSALDVVNNWANAQNKVAYGNAMQGQALTGNAAAGMSGQFPTFNDPRAIQDQLAQMAQGTIQVPGISQQQAYEEFMRQVQGGAGANPYGGGY